MAEQGCESELVKHLGEIRSSDLRNADFLKGLGFKGLGFNGLRV